LSLLFAIQFNRTQLKCIFDVLCRGRKQCWVVCSEQTVYPAISNSDITRLWLPLLSMQTMKGVEATLTLFKV